MEFDKLTVNLHGGLLSYMNPEVGDGSTNHHDVHDDTLVLEFLRDSMVPGMVSAKERDRVLQRARRYRLEGTHILRVWEDGRVSIGGVVCTPMCNDWCHIAWFVKG
ncbi:unnamed protein product [Sphagnum jensenii]|uniref:Uncharacterized protein n=1 Tax=Sphagnum jensenii TaxID=128206 RepID=A0ABP1BUG2_9BRYO